MRPLQYATNLHYLYQENAFLTEILLQLNTITTTGIYDFTYICIVYTSEEGGITVHQVLPGIARTKIYRHMPFQQSGFIALSFAPIMWFLMKTAEDGSQTVLFATLSEFAGKTSGMLYK